MSHLDLDCLRLKQKLLHMNDRPFCIFYRSKALFARLCLFNAAFAQLKVLRFRKPKLKR